jgi:DNA-directed RNA polymerase subunit beta'
MMALELFKPFVIQKLEEQNLVQTVKSAKKFIEKERPEVWDILEEVISDHPVLLNRAPTLHRLGIQAFCPKLVEGKAIRLHPLVCSAFNADFDGDQMAVHVPLSFESQIECRILMLSANNLLRPSNGEPVMVPSQDMVLGIYYLTKMSHGQKGEGRCFSCSEEVLHAMADNQISLHARIMVQINGTRIETSPGRIVFNEIIPDEVPYVNELLKKANLEKLVGEIIKNCGTKVACNFLDNIKDIGYEYATKAGVTFGVDDLVVPKEKQDIIDKAQSEVKRIRKQYKRGIITEGERYNKIIDIWTHATNEVSNVLYDRLKDDKEGFNSVFMMLDAKARGSQDQIKQLAGMRGLMQKPQKKITGAVGEIIENPILSNFKDGLTGLEYFISTHGARKGLADTALKTADAGYLTRRLVDVVQDIVVNEEDCGTTKGVEIDALQEGDEIIETLAARVVGRTAQQDIYDPVSDELICAVNTIIDEETAKKIENTGSERALIRSVLTCDAEFGICKKCYGRNLATGNEVDLGEAIGIIAAQSIGEPGTQLTLRTFHIGGTASRLIAKSKEVSKVDGVVRLFDIEYVEHESGQVVMTRFGEVAIFDKKERERYRYNVPHGAILTVKENSQVKKGDELFKWDPYNNVLIANKSGIIQGVDLKEGETIRELYDDQTGMTNIVVVEDRSRILQPHIRIIDQKKNILSNIAVPAGAFLQVRTKDKVTAGDILFKIPRDSGKSRDITGGLPRVAELFEARKPKDIAVISEIDGIVEFKMRPVKDKNGKGILDKEGNPLMEPDIERGNRKVIIHDETRDENHDDSKEYPIPVAKHMRVHDGDRVNIGQRLCEGAINPHDILRVLGERAVQKYLIDEIQAVYRLQGVKINDKHIEVIASQMLRKVKIEDPGDTEFLQHDGVDRKLLRKENNRVITDGNKPATFTPLLLGITKASLTTESFLSAASFQETTKVLAKAAVEGKTDNLYGLKENLIMGNLIPAGTGTRKYKNLKVKDIEADIVRVGEEYEENPDFDGLSGEIL